MCKSPQPGKAKTRLTPPLSAQDAARVASALLCHVAHRLHRVDVSLLICHDPPGAAQELRDLLALPDVACLPQSAGNLGDRLAAASEHVFESSSAVLFFGTDSPDVPETHIARAIEMSETHDVVAGNCDDGGFWCLGLRGHVPVRNLLVDIPWSSGRELHALLNRARDLGLSAGDPGAWSDVDRYDDLRALVERLRNSRTIDDQDLWRSLEPFVRAPATGAIRSHGGH